ncbi:hypothetical protein [Laribacter hongkongensis]|uniref:hypothetical protein n=1 Tax=Laribacter hongkongensis TaxID=168471 RepID=UPI00117CB04B|nr:hypothetical protein [Laribacter hongkongensis]MCG9031404.1 hypothetical protein [Laribacter hongkongensis]MCG9091624.1 hypothetical protein [Laribacter hongkongensis]MCG9124991.1 hypothetical protein [Laribacter hongkongensis]
MSHTSCKPDKVDRLAKIISDNRDRFTVSRDGRVKMDLTNEKVIKSIMDTVDKVSKLKLVKG